jgi:polyisoprenyl-phosphate glycosyltransferase
MTDSKPVLSVVIPVYNEEEGLKELYQQLITVLTDINLSYEIIFVDDGSCDQSFTIIQELHAQNKQVIGLRFSRNFGHQAAISAAYEQAQGRAILCMDADLQHPPELIPQFIRKWQEGYHVIIGVKKEESDSLYRKLTTGLAYRLIRVMAEIDIPAHAPDFRLLDRKALNALLALPERQRLLRGLVIWIGFKRTEIEFEVASRFAGRSSYSFVKLAALAINGAFSFSIVPLRISTILGLLVSLAGFAYLIFVVSVRLFTNLAPEGWTSVLAASLLLGGCQLMVLGVIGEYIGRIYHEVKERPLYLIEDVIGVQQISTPKDYP